MARICTLRLIDKMVDAMLLQSMYADRQVVDSTHREEFKAMIIDQWPKAGSIFNTNLILPTDCTELASHYIAKFNIAESQIYFITIYYLNGEYGINLQSSANMSFWILFKFKNLCELETKIRECKRSIHDLIDPGNPWYLTHEGNPLP
jgi:hypothetical protein